MFFLLFLSLLSLLLLFFSLQRRGDHIMSIVIYFGLFRRFFNALLNTSAFICRLLDIAKNTMLPIIFVFISTLSCYLMQDCDRFVYTPPAMLIVQSFRNYCVIFIIHVGTFFFQQNPGTVKIKLIGYRVCIIPQMNYQTAS